MHASWVAVKTRWVMCVNCKVLSACNSCGLHSFPDVERCSEWNRQESLALLMLKTLSGLHIAAYHRGPQECPFPQCPLPESALHSPYGPALGNMAPVHRA